MRKLVISILVMIFSFGLWAKEQEKNIFIGYETLEMFMNNCKYFAGEIGYKFDDKNQIRLTVMETVLSERHLSSKYEAMAVDGKNVEGYFQGYELHYDRFLSKYFYVSASLGYYHDTYKHTILEEELNNETFTVGSGLGFRRHGFLGIDRMYYNFDLPVRYYFDNIEETELGNTTILEHTIINNIWFFIGYEF